MIASRVGWKGASAWMLSFLAGLLMCFPPGRNMAVARAEEGQPNEFEERFERLRRENPWSAIQVAAEALRSRGAEADAIRLRKAMRSLGILCVIRSERGLPMSCIAGSENLIAAGDFDGEVRLVDQSGECIALLREPSARAIVRVWLARRGEDVLYLTEAGILRRVKRDGWLVSEMRLAPEMARIHAVSTSLDTVVASAEAGRAVVVCDTRLGKQVTTLPVSVKQVAFSQSEDHAWFLLDDGRVVSWNPREGLGDPSHSRVQTAVAIVPIGGGLLTADKSGRVELQERDSIAVLRESGSEIRQLLATPSGTVVAWLDQSGSVEVVGRDGRKVSRPPIRVNRGQVFAMDDEGGFLAVMEGGGHLVSSTTGDRQRRIVFSEPPIRPISRFGPSWADCAFALSGDVVAFMDTGMSTVVCWADPEGPKASRFWDGCPPASLLRKAQNLVPRDLSDDERALAKGLVRPGGR